MIRVKTKADFDKLTGRAPEVPDLAPTPAPAPVAAAPAPRPAPEAGPTASPIDTEARALVVAMARTVNQLAAVVMQDRAAPQPMPAPAPPVAPEPAPPPAVTPIPLPLITRPPRSTIYPTVAKGEETAQPVPVKPAAPIEATILRDKRDRLETVSVTGGMKATIHRDKQDRMSAITIEREGNKQTATVHRDKKGRIQKMTIGTAA